MKLKLGGVVLVHTDESEASEYFKLKTLIKTGLSRNVVILITDAIIG